MLPITQRRATGTVKETGAEDRAMLGSNLSTDSGPDHGEGGPLGSPSFLSPFMGWHNRDKSWGSQGAKPPVLPPTPIMDFPKLFNCSSDRKSPSLENPNRLSAQCSQPQNAFSPIFSLNLNTAQPRLIAAKALSVNYTLGAGTLFHDAVRPE